MERSVAAIIPVRNDARDLPLAVASLLTQTTASLREVVLSVGPSTDESMKVASELAASSDIVRVIENPSGRTPEAMNLGIAATEGDVVVRVDARSVLPIDYIENALESMAETGAANIGAVQVPVGDTPTQRAIAGAMRSRAGSGGALYRHSSRLRKVDTAYLGVFRREALSQVGGFDESFERNQDGELNTRLNAAGFEVWVDPRLRVKYRPRASLRALGSQFWQYGWWRQKTLRKNRGSMQLRQIAAAVLPFFLLLLGVLLLIGQLWAALPLAGYAALLLASAGAAKGLTLRERCAMVAALSLMHIIWGLAFAASYVTSALSRSG